MVNDVWLLLNALASLLPVPARPSTSDLKHAFLVTSMLHLTPPVPTYMFAVATRFDDISLVLKAKLKTTAKHTGAKGGGQETLKPFVLVTFDNIPVPRGGGQSLDLHGPF